MEPLTFWERIKLRVVIWLGWVEAAPLTPDEDGVIHVRMYEDDSDVR